MRAQVEVPNLSAYGCQTVLHEIAPVIRDRGNGHDIRLRRFRCRCRCGRESDQSLANLRALPREHCWVCLPRLGRPPKRL